ncbi:MAG: GMC family oxidoreductase [Phycisphaerae bacterium]|nr:GMC family oxidoreductase [Phycisphaerae bacterium]
MSPTESFDIIIIGTGAGGGTIARRLAPSGLRILILERGGFLPRERENWDTKAVHADKRYLTKETWYDRDDQAFSPYTHYWVGGNTKVYGAALLRLRPSDFGEVRHYGGVSPAWPIGYDELERYYSEAEWMYCVHGERHRDPHDPPASRDYPFGPIEHEPRIAELACDLRDLGLRPFPMPIGVRLPNRPREQAPLRLSHFDGYPDVTESKADSHVIGVEAALAHPNVSILTGALAQRLVVDSSGRRVVGVEVLRDGRIQTYHGGTIVVACGAVNSAALFLRSACDGHPNGLANSSGMVGRNYMCHNNSLFVAVTGEPNPSRFQKTFGLTDFYRGVPDSSLPLGTIQLMGKPDPDTIRWLQGDRLPGLSAEDILAHSIDFFLTAEDLPDAENRVTLRADGSIRLCYRENNLEALRRLEHRLMITLDSVDRVRGRRAATYLTAKLGVSGVSHQCGTLRFGIDPRTSVLDTDCKAHDLDNLYVVDSSCFPSSGAVNPSLTIMANALRVGDHLLGRLGAGAAVKATGGVARSFVEARA